MLDIKYIREHADQVRRNCKLRKSQADVDELLKVDSKYLEDLREIEVLRAERNQIAEQMSDPAKRETLSARGKELKGMIAEKESDIKSLEQNRFDLLHKLPNLTHPDTPEGEGDEQNLELRRVGQPTEMVEPKDHLAICQALDLVDFERGAKVSGAKFYFLKNKLAILEQAVLRYAMDFMMREGFELLVTPEVAKEQVLIGKGFQPRGPEKQVYFIEGQDMALIGTSEITVLGYHMGEVLKGEEMPKKYVAFSHCFRTEAGSYGRESYGFYRVHQFSKVEMFAFAKPEQSEAIHTEFLAHEERFWKSLGIPYRVVDCCTGDLGGSDYRRFDIEAWMWGKGQGKGGWGEVTSTSNCIDFQARGLDIKYETKEGERGYVHTLNGTVIATPRALIAILENYQQPDGSVKIPEVLIPYCGFDSIS